MRGKAIPLEKKQETARLRMEARAARARAREDRKNRKYVERLLSLEADYRQRIKVLKDENLRMRERAGAGPMVFPTPAERTQVKNFRIERGWKIGRMAKACQVEHRQIQLLERADQSVYLSRRAFERIMHVVDASAPVWPEKPFSELEIKLLETRGVVVPTLVRERWRSAQAETDLQHPLTPLLIPANPAIPGSDPLVKTVEPSRPPDPDEPWECPDCWQRAEFCECDRVDPDPASDPGIDPGIDPAPLTLPAPEPAPVVCATADPEKPNGHATALPADETESEWLTF